jgi:hypothetical protein
MEKHWLKVFGVALAALIIIPVIFNYWLAPTIFSENRDAGEQIAEDTLDSEKAVQDYRDFRRLWFDIKSAREQLDNYQQQEKQFHETYGDDPKEWSRTAETRHGRIHDRITGQRNQISNLVSEYNAMSADSTTSLYQCHLPWKIDEKLFISDASGVEYKSGANTGPAPENPNSSCKYSNVPDGALNSSG